MSDERDPWPMLALYASLIVGAVAACVLAVLSILVITVRLVLGR